MHLVKSITNASRSLCSIALTCFAPLVHAQTDPNQQVACCDDQGVGCVTVTFQQCEEQPGFSVGSTDYTCAQFQSQFGFTPCGAGACCIGVCIDGIQTAACVSALEGEPFPNQTCPDLFLCPSEDETGACCFTNGACVITTETNCTEGTFPGSFYYGDDTTCDVEGAGCVQTGACCLNAVCSRVFETECEGIGGEFFGSGSRCGSSGSCPVAPCCGTLEQPGCAGYQSEASCLAQGLVWSGRDQDTGEIDLDLFTGASSSCDICPCEIDFNQDTFRDASDVTDFVTALDAQDPLTDRAAPTNTWDVVDVLDFLAINCNLTSIFH